MTALVEILLKQTRADSVEHRIRRFTEQYPSPQALSAASLLDLERDLAPFGFQRQRAAHLKAFGTVLSSNPQMLRRDEKALLSLPGIGPYAASAIRCFVYGARDPVIDVNIVRIVERVFGVAYERGEGRRNKEVKRLAKELLNGRQPREMNWGLLDLGALVCRESKPRCSECPVKEICSSSAHQVVAA